MAFECLYDSSVVCSYDWHWRTLTLIGCVHLELWNTYFSNLFEILTCHQPGKSWKNHFSVWTNRPQSYNKLPTLPVTGGWMCRRCMCKVLSIHAISRPRRSSALQKIFTFQHIKLVVKKVCRSSMSIVYMYMSTSYACITYTTTYITYTSLHTTKMPQSFFNIDTHNS